MSQQVQEILSQLLKTQLQKKSTIKVQTKVSASEFKKRDSRQENERQKSKNDLIRQKDKMLRDHEREQKVVEKIEEENWAFYRRIIVENAAKIFMILLYFIISSIAICKAGIIILTALQNLLYDALISVPPSSLPPKY